MSRRKLGISPLSTERQQTTDGGSGDGYNVVHDMVYLTLWERWPHINSNLLVRYLCRSKSDNALLLALQDFQVAKAKEHQDSGEAIQRSQFVRAIRTTFADLEQAGIGVRVKCSRPTCSGSDTSKNWNGIEIPSLVSTDCVWWTEVDGNDLQVSLVLETKQLVEMCTQAADEGKQIEIMKPGYEQAERQARANRHLFSGV